MFLLLKNRVSNRTRIRAVAVVIVAVLFGVTLFHEPLSFTGRACACGGGGDGGGGGGGGGSDGGGGNAGDPSTTPPGFEADGGVSIHWTGDTSSGPLTREIEEIQRGLIRLEGVLRAFHLEEQEQFRKEAIRHQRNADILSIFKYGLHVVSLSTSIYGLVYSPSAAQLNRLARWGKVAYQAESARGNLGLAQSVVDTYSAAQAAVAAVKSLATSPKSP